MITYSTITIFLVLIVGGFIIESIFAQIHFLVYRNHFKKYNFSFGRYLFYLLFPLVALIYSFVSVGYQILPIFLAFSIIGTTIEWLAGFSYHMILGQRLWSYHRYSIGRYTSLLSIPLWGVAGVLFWMLNRVI